MFKYLKIFFILALIFGAWFFLRPEESPEEKISNQTSIQEEVVVEEKASQAQNNIKIEEPQKPLEEIIEPQIILLNAPFLAQAPFGQWDDPIYQDACEEASLITAILWARGVESISKEEASAEIKKFSDFELEKYNNFYDHSAADTAQIMKDYFGYYNIKIQENITTKDIVAELEKGNLVIVPINGQILKNPFYTPPGPDRHMLVVVGYDFQSEEFITNDVGTRQGQGFRYKKDVLEMSIRDYPTGHKEPISGVLKNMIVVWK